MTEPMQFMMIFHSKLFPASPQLKLWRCGCGRVLFKANSTNITVSNDIGLGWTEYPPGADVIELQCHSCKSKYKIIFQ